MRGRYARRAEADEFEEDERSSADRWVISYADFITLMFAFFVVMYSISSVNDGKFRVLSASLEEVFKDPALAEALEQRRERAQQAAPARENESLDSDDAEFAPAARMVPENLRADELTPVLKTLLAELITAGDVQLQESEDWTEVELNADYAFGKEGHELAPGPAAVVSDLASLARAVETPVRVEGYTDAPGHLEGEAAQKWQESAARAASVAAAMVEGGMDPSQVSAAAFGDRHPIDSNDNPEGRKRNRRVVVSIGRHDNLPAAAVSLGALKDVEDLPAQILQRVTELPGPEAVSL
jgi:chemotaxis protein MotB